MSHLGYTTRQPLRNSSYEYYERVPPFSGTLPIRVAEVGRIVSPYVSKLEWMEALCVYLWMSYPWLKSEDRVSILDAQSARMVSLNVTNRLVTLGDYIGIPK